MSDAPVGQIAGYKDIRRALLRKEWFEHRWRFVLGTVVMSTLLAAMLRAQVIPFHEATIMIYWPIGTFMTIFLAMGPIATEKTGRTWEFLVAQPIPKMRILFAKWRMGLYQLVAMCMAAMLAGVVAMWSRGFYGRSTAWAYVGGEEARALQQWIDMLADHPAIWLIVLALAATVSLCCWYTFLFFALIRARNEFEAALGGLLLTIAAHVWLGQVAFDSTRYFAVINPFIIFVILSFPKYLHFLAWAVLVQALVWIVAPVLLVPLRLRRQSHV